MTSIQDRLNRKDWDPSPGDQLVGEIVDVTERETRFGAYPLLVVRDDAGVERNVHCLRGGLLWPVVRARPNVGDRVGIRYDGQSDGQDAHRYAVAFENAAETAPDWDKIEKSQRERSRDDGKADANGVDAAWPVKSAEPT